MSEYINKQAKVWRSDTEPTNKSFLWVVTESVDAAPDKTTDIKTWDGTAWVTISENINEALELINGTGSGAYPFEIQYADTIKRWEVKCLTGTAKEYGRYNSTTKLFECNEFDSTNPTVEDRGFTLDEAMAMLTEFESPKVTIPNYYQDQRFKTSLSIFGDEYQIYNSWGFLGFYTSSFKSIRLTTDLVQPYNSESGNLLVYYTRNVTSLYGIVRFRYKPTQLIHLSGVVNFKFIIGISDATAYDWDMSAHNTTASFDSLFYLLNNWGNTTNPLVTQRTLTLHADLYDKIYNPANPDYAEYNPLHTEATRKNINIATP